MKFIWISELVFLNLFLDMLCEFAHLCSVWKYQNANDRRSLQCTGNDDSCEWNDSSGENKSDNMIGVHYLEAPKYFCKFNFLYFY